jgi:hypothetical protein
MNCAIQTPVIHSREQATHLEKLMKVNLCLTSNEANVLVALVNMYPA